MVSTADRKERKTLYQERSSTLLQGLLFLLFYNMEDREDELSVSLQKTPGKKRPFTVELDAEIVEKCGHNIVVPLALMTLFGRGGEYFFAELWSTYRKQNKNNSGCRLQKGFYKVVFCCYCNYSLCFHILSSIAHRNHMEPSGINTTREQRRVFVVLAASVNLFTFLVPLLTPVCSKEAV